MKISKPHMASGITEILRTYIDIVVVQSPDTEFGQILLLYFLGSVRMVHAMHEVVIGFNLGRLIRDIK